MSDSYRPGKSVKVTFKTLNKREWLKRNFPPIAPYATPELMAGDTLLERTLNAYLTNNFITPFDIPNDECLYAAEHIIKIFRALDDHEKGGIMKPKKTVKKKTVKKTSKKKTK